MINEEFKKKCLQAFQYSSYLDRIILYLNNNSINDLRIVFDNATDELQREINQKIGTGEESIHNARVHQLTNMFVCLNELYDLIDINDITNKPRLLHETRD